MKCQFDHNSIFVKYGLNRLAPRMFALLIIIQALLFIGCTSNPIDLVKKGTLGDLDNSVTVGNAFDGYKYFDTKSWEKREDQQKRKYVEFRGHVLLGTILAAPTDGAFTITPELIEQAKQMFVGGEIIYIAQFVVGSDGESFNLQYSGIEVQVKNKNTGEVENKSMSDRNLWILKNIFNNDPGHFVAYTIGILNGNY